MLNPKGRVWLMVAGGGASVIYTDTVADLGYAQVRWQTAHVYTDNTDRGTVADLGYAQVRSSRQSV